MTQDRFFTPRPGGVLDDYDFEQVVERGLAAFAKSAPDAALDLAIRLLDEALALSEPPALVERRQDFSTMWRPAIDRPPQHGGSHARASALVDVVRDASVALARADPSSLSDLITRLKERRWPLFRRLALHLLLEVPDVALIRTHILDPDELVSDLPEHDRLVRAHIGDLGDEDRERYVELIEQRPRYLTYASGEPVDPGEAESWLEAWRLRRLRAIADNLPARARDRYPDLARSPTPMVEDHLIESGWVSEPPKIGPEELAAMSLPEILEHLRTWEPTGAFMGPTINSQADALKAAATSDPARFSEHANAFRGLDPTYARGLLGGLTDAVKAGTRIAWAPVLDLARWAAAQPREKRSSTWERDPGWAWTRRQIADLLSEGLRERDAQIAGDLRENAWAVLEVLVDDDPESSAMAEENEHDPIAATLNSNRGAALQAIITYLDWVRRHSDAPRAPAMELAPEARRVLERFVDPANDSGAATRGTFGMRLVNLTALDESWRAITKGCVKGRAANLPA